MREKSDSECLEIQSCERKFVKRYRFSFGLGRHKRNGGWNKNGGGECGCRRFCRGHGNVRTRRESLANVGASKWPKRRKIRSIVSSGHAFVRRGRSARS